MLTITLQDGSKREFSEGMTLLEIAEKISSKLAKNVVAGVFNGQLSELSQVINDDGELALLNFEDEKARDVYRHSSSHVMAQAVKRLWPDARLAIGPAIDKGFYYDFDTDHTFTPEDFANIEKEMAAIIKNDYPIIRREMPRPEALELFRERGEIYKVELIEDLPEDAVISFYQQGEFIDLCAGPHLPSTGRLKAVKIMSLAGA